MFLTAISFGTEEVMRSILCHVERLVTITCTSSVATFPVGIPKCASTCVIKLAHAAIVIPGKVSGAAAIKSGMHVCSRIGFNPRWLISVI
jgi:hypothetical protein